MTDYSEHLPYQSHLATQFMPISTFINKHGMPRVNTGFCKLTFYLTIPTISRAICKNLTFIFIQKLFPYI